MRSTVPNGGVRLAESGREQERRVGLAVIEVLRPERLRERAGCGYDPQVHGHPEGHADDAHDGATVVLEHSSPQKARPAHVR